GTPPLRHLLEGVAACDGLLAVIEPHLNAVLPANDFKQAPLPLSAHAVPAVEIVFADYEPGLTPLRRWRWQAEPRSPASAPCRRVPLQPSRAEVQPQASTVCWWRELPPCPLCGGEASWS